MKIGLRITARELAIIAGALALIYAFHCWTATTTAGYPSRATFERGRVELRSFTPSTRHAADPVDPGP